MMLPTAALPIVLCKDIGSASWTASRARGTGKEGGSSLWVEGPFSRVRRMYSLQTQRIELGCLDYRHPQAAPRGEEPLEEATAGHVGPGAHLVRRRHGLRLGEVLRAHL